MYKKTLMTVVMMGIIMVGFAQTDQKKSANPKDLVKVVAENSHKELLDKMQRRLKDRNEPKLNKEFGSMTESKQFLFQEQLIDTVLRAKSHTLKDVFVKMCDKANMPTEFIYEDINIGNVVYKTFETGKKQGQIDSTAFVVPVSFQAHTVAKDKISDVKYAVTLNWEVGVKMEYETVMADGKKVKQVVGYVQNGTPVLMSSVAQPIKYLTSEKKAMRDVAKKAIVEWYANIPHRLDKQYAEQSITTIDAMNISPNDVKFNLPEGQSFVVSDVPTIKVNIDPYQFIESSNESVYTDPSSYMILAPTFDVYVDDTFNNAKIVVSYAVKDVVKPIADKEKELRRNGAHATILEIADKLSLYVVDSCVDSKLAIANMFTTHQSSIEVSYLPKYGSEKIKTDSVQEYLSLLKGQSLKWTIDSLEVVNSNWDALIYTIGQNYHSKRYSDYTQKRVHLKYDETKGAYVIDKIEVVRNSTKTK